MNSNPHNHDSDHQTCCPPGQVFSLDTTWQPPRCGADHELENVSDQGTQRVKFHFWLRQKLMESESLSVYNYLPNFG